MGKVEPKTLNTGSMVLPQNVSSKRASDLVASLDGPADIAVLEACDLEICHRINEIAAGKARLLDVDDVLTRVRARTGIR